MPIEKHVTYCRICEPLCGLIATVEDGRLRSLRPDPDHPLSRGQACPKGIAFTDIQNDPDRVLHPLRRNAAGGFERVGWDEALDDIAARLRGIAHDEIGIYFGNPAAFSYSHALWAIGFAKGLGTKHLYGPGSQDTNSRFVASSLLYGSVVQLPFPDLPRTDFLLMVGANPLISHGSAVSAPRIKDHLSAIVQRGGRVVVVDPRRTETARAYEHLAVRPDGDAWLLLSLLHVVFAESLADEAAIARQSTGIDLIRTAAAAYPPEDTETITGVTADDVRRLARDFAAAPSAVAYGRTGSCLGRNATLVGFLIDVLTLVTGNLDRAGGALFSRGVIPAEDIAERAGMATYAGAKSRLGGFPDVLGAFPAALMADEITTPGKGRMRALIVTAGNPVLSVPNGKALSEALGRLDVMVSIDIYVNETNRHADYVLPATTWLEREDYPMGVSSAAPTTFVQATEAVVPAYGEARPDWQIIDDIARRAGIGMFHIGPLRRLAGLTTKVPIRLTPRPMIETLLRLGTYGDWFGLRRGGLNPQKLRENPHGVVLSEHAATGRIGDAVRHRNRKVRLDPPEIAAELTRLTPYVDADFPLKLIGMRELRSHNSWQHNAPTLMTGKRRHAARINPADASAAGIADGAPVRIRSRHGEIETVALLTDEVGPGTVAVPHGWGHEGGSWTLANASGGANVNQLMSTAIEDIERLAGMSHLNGVPVVLEACGTSDANIAGRGRARRGGEAGNGKR
ncbi:formate dehydrogenase [Nocardia nova]|uniref:molybdopterin-dependent oxidoreductase n=1 Tax=Nocardia nova TaxID=37330 RepID=UPI0025B1D982|nr:molybdopterin-dependent oxidoreductase [Nocardia nova]MDN2495201.1 formate dehydrogenase [Nocardia nova]